MSKKKTDKLPPDAGRKIAGVEKEEILNVLQSMKKENKREKLMEALQENRNDHFLVFEILEFAKDLDMRDYLKELTDILEEENYFLNRGTENHKKMKRALVDIIKKVTNTSYEVENINDYDQVDGLIKIARKSL
jgi:hypothetical protein